MKDTKLPHFPFFARDWLTDERVMLMTLECQGAYLKLLCYQWLEKSVPANVKQLAALCGVTPEHFSEEIWPDLTEAFQSIGERLQNPRLEKIRVSTEELIAKKSEAGRRGAEKRWKGKDSTPISTPIADQSDPNAIHIQSHSQIQEEDGSRDSDSSGVMSEESATVHEALMFKFRFGHLKAMDIVERLSPTMADLEDWDRYEDAKGTRLAMHNMKRYKNPREIPQEKQGTETTTTNKRKTFAQMDADDYAAKKAEFDKERESDVSGNTDNA